MKFFSSIVLFLCLLTGFLSAEDFKSSVGIPIKLESIEIEGSMVIAKPRLDTKTPIIIRISKSTKVENGFLYDLTVEGLDVGSYDLRNYLVRVNGDEAISTPIPFEVTSSLKDINAEPNKLETTKTANIGGYRNWVIALTAIWLVCGCLFLIRKKKSKSDNSEEAELTLTQKVQPILQKASKQELTVEDKAQLDRLLIGHWTGKFPQIESYPLAEAVKFLKLQKSSAPVMLAMEKWLHSKNSISADELTKTLDSCSQSVSEEDAS